MANQTSISEFLLLEFSEVRELQVIHFIFFLALYFATLAGNLLIIAAIAFDHHLHMYFFLMNLAMQDIGSISAIIPKSMVNSLMNIRHISYFGCVAQVFALIFFAGSGIALLTVMAYDRYVAICNPLHYEILMNRTACTQLVASGTFASPFCSSLVNQMFCEIPQLLKLACSDLHYIEQGFILFSIVIASGCFIFTTVTYAQILTAVLKIPSVQGRKKAFSTCLPHLIVFSIFLLTACFAYLRPTPDQPSNLDLVFTLLYSILPPMLNPVIYSMRNRDIKVALSRLLSLGQSS
uniref:Olfactory receptor n=1 Tax=Varanus komodoensis TaxID=61221 RepID=A0A8D2L418_VARKO